MGNVTLFCEKCGEPNSAEVKHCIHCGSPIEGPSQEFLAQAASSELEGRRFDLKILLPGIKVGAVAGVISGLIWGLFRLFIYSAIFSGSGLSIAGMTVGGILLLGIYLIFNVICGIVTGSVLAFFSVIHDVSGCRFYSVIVNIIIGLFVTFPIMFLQTIGLGSTLPIFIGCIKCIISGAIGGSLFATTIPLIYQQYFTNK